MSTEVLNPAGNPAPTAGGWFASRLAFYLFVATIAAVTLLAWTSRDYRYIHAESGMGYALGIVGAGLMVLLLLYPLRKRVAAMQRWGRLSGWFRTHMLLGILGPFCIILHSNFQLGSTNSTIALTSMLLVAGSGLFGRYLYGKFHYGLYGEEVRLKQILSDFEAFRPAMASGLLDSGDEERLAQLYAGCHAIARRQAEGDVSFFGLLRQRRWLLRQRRSVAAIARDNPEVRATLTGFAATLRRLAGLRVCERLFSAWHVFHIPIFLLMVICAVVHVIVVHWY